MMPSDTEDLIRKVNALTLDKNRLKQKLTQLSLAFNKLDKPITISQTGNNAISQSQGNPDDKDQLVDNKSSNINSSPSSNIIFGVECATSCEEDLLYMVDLYRRQLDQYDDNWEYVQSKCTAFLSELTALQKQYALLKDEKSKFEQELKSKCDECDKIRSELQTVVLNYETQLGTMSEHLSMITSKINLDDN